MEQRRVPVREVTARPSINRYAEDADLPERARPHDVARAGGDDADARRVGAAGDAPSPDQRTAPINRRSRSTCRCR